MILALRPHCRIFSFSESAFAFYARAIVFAATVFLGLTLTRATLAASCCAGGGGQTLCVLPAEQGYQVGLSNTVRSVRGDFDPYGDYSSFPAGTSTSQIVTVFGGAYRVNDDWQLGLSVPFTTSLQTMAEVTHRASASGDPALEGRYLLWEDLAFLTFRPQLAFYGGLRVPFGTSIYTTRDPMALDAVGDGVMTLHAGVNAAKLFRPVKWSMDAAVFYPRLHTVDKMRGEAVALPYTFKLGNRLQLAESANYLINQEWSATMGFKQVWTAHSLVGGVESEGSAQRLFTTATSVNYFYDNAWSVGLSYETEFPFYRYEVNQPYAHSVALAITYGGI